MRVEHEGEVAPHGQEIGGHQRRARQPLPPLRRQRLQEHLECSHGAGDIERAQRVGVKLAEVGKSDLGSEPERAGAAGMEPGRGLARHLRLAGVEAELGQERGHVRLGVVEACLRRRPRPMAPRAGERRRTGTHAAGGDVLVLGRIAAIGLSHLE